MRTESLADRAAFGSFLASLMFVPVSITLFEIASIATILLAFWATWREGRLKSLAGPFAALAGLWVAMNLLSVTQSQFPSASWRGVFKVFRHAALCLAVVATVRDEKRFRTAFLFFLGIAAIVCLDAFAQKFLGVDPICRRTMTPYLLEKVYRITGPFKHSNDFAAYLCLTLFSAAAVTSSARRLGAQLSWIPWVTAAFSLMALVGTYTRGAWLAGAATAVAYAIVKRSRAVVGLLVLATLWALFLSPTYVRQRVLSLADVRTGTILERRTLWSESIRMIRARPVLGFGSNTYARVMPSYKTDTRTDKQYAHNGFLQLTAETGLLGLAALLAFLGYYFRQSVRVFVRGGARFVPSAGLGLATGVFAFLVYSLTDTNLQALQLVNSMWMAIGLSWAARRLESS